jgi:uncharacterized tellurite resistance protein B-like protein
MIDLVRKFFGKRTEGTPTDAETDRPHDIRVATCALFLEMASIDGEFSDSERENIVRALKENHQLSDECAADLIEASQEELKGSIDLWRFTTLVNQNYSMPEKIRIVEMLWEIVYADGKLDKHEDYLVRKLAGLLRLNHKQLIDAKLKVVRGDAG